MREITPPLNLAFGCLLLALLCAPVAAQEKAANEAPNEDLLKLDYALIYPDEKAPEIVKVEEENPFVALTEITEEDVGNSEENTIKDRLLAMKVVGFSKRAQGGYRVQLGDISLEEGKIVPNFLPDQSVHLRVNSITESEIELVWMEKQRSGLPPRTLLVPIRIRPMVRQMLAGHRGSETAEPVFGLHQESVLKAAGATTSSAPPRGEVIKEETANATATTAEVKPAEPARKKSAADAVLDMFFNQGGNVPAPK